MPAEATHRSVDRSSVQNSPIAIVCGHGILPFEVAQGAMAAGRRPLMIGIEGAAEPSIETFDHRYMKLGQFGALQKLLRKEGISQLVMAGGLHARPEVLKMGLDWGAISSIPKAMAMLWGGDDNLLTGLIKLFADHHIEVLGAHEIAPNLLAGSGAIVGNKPGRKGMTNIELAVRACRALGELDVGQASIAEANRIVGIEGVEGTDRLLRRIADLRKIGRMPLKGKNGVLVKLVKSGQDHRVDLPAIGPKTIESVCDAGLFGIAIDAKLSLILQREETLRLARKNKVYIFGYEDREIKVGAVA